MANYVTNYKDLKLRASSSPHIRTKEDAHNIMLDVIIAMLPALAFAVYNFGLRALTLTAVSVVGCVVFEALYRILTGKHQTVGDLSAVVTGMLIAFVCPVGIDYWIVLIGDFFAIVVVKQLYGGLGKNFLNPALAARAFMFSWAGAMSTWVAPGTRAPLWGSTVDVVTYPTPMAFLAENDMVGLAEVYDIKTMFLGMIGGSMGEVSAICLICGLVYMLAKKVILWNIPVTYIGTVAVLTFLFPRGNDPLTWMLYNVLGGGLLLGAIFMATDYVTSPVSRKGQFIYGIGCGLITVFIRYFGGYNEGVCYAILCMNLVVWLIDKNVKPSRFGVAKKPALQKKEADKK